MNQQQFQMAVPLTPMVKRLIIACAVIWIGGILILQGLVLGGRPVDEIFALSPYMVVTRFWIWQLLTYMFLHSTNVFHILFNMLSLWWFGAELETRWGGRFFLAFYLACGVGAGVIYTAATYAYYYFTGNTVPMTNELVGASGAVYGLLLAYGLLFGERMIFFMMLFPMKAKYFTMIIGLVELVTLMDSTSGSKAASLAHLGGLVAGFVFLAAVARWRSRGSASAGSKRGRRLKLVVNNDRQSSEEPGNGPKYWN